MEGREREQGLEWPLGFEGTVWRMRGRYNPSRLFPFLPVAAQELRVQFLLGLGLSVLGWGTEG